MTRTFFPRAKEKPKVDPQRFLRSKQLQQSELLFQRVRAEALRGSKPLE